MSSWGLPFGYGTPAADTNTNNATAPRQRVFYAAVWKNTERPAHEVSSWKDTAGIINPIHRRAFNAALPFTVRTTVETPQAMKIPDDGSRPPKPADPKKKVLMSVDVEGAYTLHCRSLDNYHGIVGVVVTDANYPATVANSLINRLLEDFVSKHPKDWQSSNPKPQPTWPALLKSYDDPTKNKDNLQAIQAELDATKQTLHQTIEAVLARGEKLDDLVNKSNDLNFASRAFYTTAKKQNSCCVVM